MRRSAVNRYFSKASITKLEPLIHDLAQKLCDRLLTRISNPTAFEITMAYSCFTTDVITGYCFGQTHGFLDQDDFEPNLRKAIFGGCSSLPIGKQWPIISQIVDRIPE
jgi:cytochrome P450